jgi:hypothetical protein
LALGDEAFGFDQTDVPLRPIAQTLIVQNVTIRKMIVSDRKIIREKRQG